MATRSVGGHSLEPAFRLCANAHTAAFDAVAITMYRLISLAVIVWIAGLNPTTLYARDDGRFANSPLKEWFDCLASRNELCCAFADGVGVQDVVDSQEGHYRVRIYGQWFVVPGRGSCNRTQPFRPCRRVAL